MQQWDEETDSLLFDPEGLASSPAGSVLLLQEDADEGELHARLAARLVGAAMPVEMMEILAATAAESPAGSREENIAALIDAVRKQDS